MLTAAALVVALGAYAPVVIHDSRERFALASVASAPVRVPGLDSDRRAAVYGRIARLRDGGAWLQYWLFYRGQDQDRGIVRTGRHAGDWEMVQYRLDGAGQPVEAVYAQHSGAERCGWESVEQRDRHPVVYVAHASHASYLRAGIRDRTFPDPNDEADGRGTFVRAAAGRCHRAISALDALAGPVGWRPRALVDPGRTGLPVRSSVPAAGALGRPGSLGGGGAHVPGGVRRGR